MFIEDDDKEIQAMLVYLGSMARGDEIHDENQTIGGGVERKHGAPKCSQQNLNSLLFVE